MQGYRDALYEGDYGYKGRPGTDPALRSGSAGGNVVLNNITPGGYLQAGKLLLMTVANFVDPQNKL